MDIEQLEKISHFNPVEIIFGKLIKLFKISNEQMVDFEVNNIETFREACKIRDKKIKTTLTVCGTLTITFFILSLIINPDMIFLYDIVVAAVAVLILFMIGCIFHWDKYTHKKYIEIFLTEAVKEALPDATFNYYDHIQTQELVNNCVVRKGDSMYGNSYIRDKTPGQEFEFSYFKSTEKEEYYRDGKKRTRTITLFSGNIIKTKLSRGIDGRVRIITSTKLKRKEDIGYWPSQRKSEELIDVENVEYNDNFQVFSASQHDAFLIVTPYVTERLMELKQRYKDFSFVVKGQYLYIAVQSGGLSLNIPFLISEKNLEHLSVEKEVEKIRTIVNFAKDINSYISGKL